MNKEFTSYPLSTEGFDKVTQTRIAFDALLESLKTLCPESREFSLVKTKLEEASFFAVKSISQLPANQKAPEEQQAA